MLEEEKSDKPRECRAVSIEVDVSVHVMNVIDAVSSPADLSVKVKAAGQNLMQTTVSRTCLSAFWANGESCNFKRSLLAQELDDSSLTFEVFLHPIL